MKKIVLLVAFFLLGCGVFYILTSHLESYTDPVSLLPSDTLALVDLKNPSGSFKRFQRSALGRQLEAIEWQEVLRELGYPEEQVAYLQYRVDEFRTILESPLFKELFGRRAILALLPEKGENELEGQKGEEERFLLICRPKHRTSLLRFFSLFFTGDFKDSTENFKGKKITRYSFENNFTLYSTFTDGHVLIALSDKPLKESLIRSMQNMTGENSGLPSNMEYSSLRQRANRREDQFVFANMRSLFREAELKNVMEGEFVVQQSIADDLPLQSFAFFRQPDRDIFTYTTVVRLENTGPAVHGVQDYMVQPVVNTTLRDVPVDVIFYFWTNLFNFEEVWDIFSSLPDTNQKELAANIDSFLLARTGITVRQLASMFGQQLNVNIRDLKTSGFIPVPRVSLRVEVKDRQGVERVLTELLNDLPLRRSSVDGYKVTSIMLAGGLIQPSYVFVENFLIVADSYEQIRQMTSGANNGLVQNSLFARVDVGLAEANNFALYLKNNELIDGVKEITGWAGSLFAANGGQGSGAYRVLVSRVIFPILEGMRMYRAKSVRAFTDENEIIVQSAVLVDQN